MALLAGTLVVRAEAAGRPSRTAIVAFYGQLVEVDLASCRIARRIDFMSRFGPADYAMFNSAERRISLFREDERSSWQRLDVDFSRFAVVQQMQLRGNQPPPHPGTEGVHPGSPASLRVAGVGGAFEEGRRFHLTLSDRSRPDPVVELDVDAHPDESPFEELRYWALTPDRQSLLVLSSGGFKEQAYLRIYGYPSLKRRATVPLLALKDDVPIALFAP